MVLATACGGGLAQASPSRPGPHLGATEGCLPSFWAQPENLQLWEEHGADAAVGVFFPEPEQYASMTLSDALRATPKGDVRLKLIKQAVAAILNAAHDSIDFPYSRYENGVDGRPPIVPTVADLLRSGTEQQMAEFADDLASANALECPLEEKSTPLQSAR